MISVLSFGTGSGCVLADGGVLSRYTANRRLGDGGCNLFYSSDPHAQRNLLAPFFFGIDSLDQFIVPTDDRVRREYPECMLQLVGRAIGSAFQFGDEHSQHQLLDALRNRFGLLVNRRVRGCHTPDFHKELSRCSWR